MMVLVGLIGGFLLRGLFPGLTICSWAGILASIVALILMCGVGNWALRRAEELDRERVDFASGADGENSVAAILERFPDEFRVINDLTTPCGNLDHVVVGPTGVFCLDTKNWRGVVSADGRGNCSATESPWTNPACGSLLAG